MIKKLNSYKFNKKLGTWHNRMVQKADRSLAEGAGQFLEQAHIFRFF